MSSDRELLEAAAKAAGIEIHDWNGNCPVYYIQHWSGDPRDEPQQEPRYWDPLTDDGDALRLAVKLGMVLDPRYTAPESMKFNRVNFWPIGKEAAPYQHIDFDPSDDAMAATRRAIVRAAAAIGAATQDRSAET